jgi:hypothetical protein
MLLAEDKDAIQELAAQGAYRAFADRVHARRLHSAEQNPGAGCLEDSTATSCRSTGNSAFLDAGDRVSRTSQLPSRTKIR